MNEYQELDGLWDFVFLGKVAEADVEWKDVRFPEKAPVPGAFDALPRHAGKLGMAAYRRTVKVPPGRLARLEFGAVSRWGRVYVDGQAQAENASAYGPFHVEMPAADFERREIVVLVDNRFNFERSPLNLEYVDYYQYGGIIRRVWLRVYPEERVWIDAVEVSPEVSGYRDGDVEIRVILGGDVKRISEIRIEFDESGQQIRHELQGTEGHEIIVIAKVPNPRLWSPDDPKLHSVLVSCRGAQEITFDVRDVRFGLRRMEAKAGKFWLNGREIMIRGCNRHEWHPNFGPCTPVLQMAADLQLLKDAGCNFIRNGHYPCDAQFMDLCDELGFLVWEELNAGLPRPNYATEKFLADHDRALRAMVRASFNHPCVVVHGFLNESASHEEFSRPIYENIVRTFRELDSTRLVSYASNQALADRNLDLVDFISLNLYPGWYPGWGDNGLVDDPLELILPCLRKCLEHYSAPEWKDKPLIVSEIGAEALYGWHDAHHDYFTEEYQAALLERACRELLSNPRSSGVVIWQFSDVRTWSGSRSLGRPRTFNNKGIFDEYRRPKMAAGVIGEIYRAAAKSV